MLATCAACGQPVASTAKFCAVCGQPVQRACSQCGGPIGAEARFCGTCGANVVAAVVPAGAQVRPAPPAPPAPAPFGPPLLPIAAGRRRRRSANLPALLALVAVVAVAAGGFVVLRPGASSSNATAPIVDGYPDPLALTMPESPAGSLPPINETKPTTGHLTLGAETPLAAQTIGAAGGTIAAEGLQIQVSDGTLAADTNFDVKQAPITGSTFGGFVTPITPLYLIDEGGAVFNKPVTVVLPATIPDGKTAMAFSYDDASGMLTPLMPIAQDATTLTVAATHFSPVFGGLLDMTDESAPVDSGFRPGTDDWQFKNYGAYVAPTGICEGMNLSAIWFYLNRPLGTDAPPLHGPSDNNGVSPRTPGLYWDDSYAYRFAASVQASPIGNWSMYSYLSDFHGTGDGKANYEAVKAAIKATGQPQLMTIDTDARNALHSVIVVEVESNRLLVSDPNYPGPQDNPRWIPYDPATGKLGPYSSGKSSADIAANGVRIYTRFAYIPRATAAADATIAALWAEYQSKTAGDSIFPKYDLEALAGTDEQGDNVWAPLVDGYRTSEDKLTVRLSDPRGRDGVLMTVYSGTSSNEAASPGDEVTVDLKEGQNPFGIFEEGHAPGATAWSYVDFVRLTVVRGDPTTLVFDPATVKDSQTDLGIRFKVTATGIPETAKRVSFSWSYDGDVVDEDPFTAPYEDPLTSSSNHAFSDEGDHTVTVTLYDTTGPIPRELARTTVYVKTVAATSGGHWVLTSTAPTASPVQTAFAYDGVTTTINSSNGQIEATQVTARANTVGYVSWGLPPASAAPGDAWTTKLSAKYADSAAVSCGDLEAAEGAGVSIKIAWWAKSDAPKEDDFELAAGCKGTSGSEDLSWAFPVHIEGTCGLANACTVDMSVYAYTGLENADNTWKYHYEWRP